MLVSFIKFFHLLIVLCLLGSTFVCLVLVATQKFALQQHFHLITRLNRIMLWLAVFALLTGTLLVHPKQQTFHTPWIQAAYLLVFVFATVVSLLKILKKKTDNYWVWCGIYLFLLLPLVLLIHDAVNKSTFLF